MKFHLVDELVDDLQLFGTNKVLSASPYHHFNFIVKQAYGSTSNLLQTRKKETVTVFDLNLEKQSVSNYTTRRVLCSSYVESWGSFVLRSKYISTLSCRMGKIGMMITHTHKGSFLPSLITSLLLLSKS